jgi:hypothetical protein
MTQLSSFNASTWLLVFVLGLLPGLLAGHLIYLDSTATGFAGFGIFTTQGSTIIDLCQWETTESSLDMAGGRLRERYHRTPHTRNLSCEAYYQLIKQAYEDRRVKQTQGYQFDPWEVWQCWYDDPCSCETPRS